MDKHVAKLFLLDFQQSGIHLNDEDRQVTSTGDIFLDILGVRAFFSFQMVVRLNDDALQLGQHFSAGAHRPRSVSRDLVRNSPIFLGEFGHRHFTPIVYFFKKSYKVGE